MRNFEKLFDDLSDTSNTKQDEMVRVLDEKVSRDIERFSFNTAVPHFMKFVNDISKEKEKNKEVVWKALDILEPFTPSFVKTIKEKYVN